MAYAVSMAVSADQFGATGQSGAQVFFSGNNLYAMRSSASDRDVCQGYILGISDVMWRMPINFRRACAPPNVISNQLVDVVLEWLKRYPQKRQYDGPYAVAEALMEAYTCQ
jgi:hypothetical protein